MRERERERMSRGRKGIATEQREKGGMGGGIEPI